MDAIAPSLAELERRLRDGGQGLQELLSPDFRGLSVAPEHEVSVPVESAFRVRRADWPVSALQQGSEFAAALVEYLAPHRPLSLADVFAVSISGSPQDHPVKITTRLRFELASVAPSSVAPLYERRPANPNAGHRPALQQASSAGDDAGPFQSRLQPALPRWQASGVWEVDWARENAGWKIAAWRPAEMTVVEGPATTFIDVTESAFVRDPTYEPHLRRDTNYWRAVLDKASGIDIFGNSGVSVGDADGDGCDEIYLCQPQGLPNRLYRQRRDKPGEFEDFARQAGVDALDNTSMALFADILNRGRQDLVVITETSPLLFLNDGQGRFELKRDAFPPSTVEAALTGAALADYDRDGYLDLYVCAYGYVEGEGSTLPSPYYDAHNGPPNRLFHNRGDGTFTDVTAASGLDHGNDRFSFACAWNDVDGDGWPDLAVVNDFGRNNFYRNLGKGKFEEVAEALPGWGSGMSAAFADFAGAGRASLYVSNMWVPAGERVTAEPEFQERFRELPPDLVREFAMGNALYVNPAVAAASSPPPAPVTSRAREKNTKATVGGETPPLQPKAFRAAPDAAGARRGRWAWSADAIDLENSGRLDLYVVNGYLSSSRAWPERTERNPAGEPGRATQVGGEGDAATVPLDSYLWEEVVARSPHTNVVGSEYRAAWSAISQLAHEGYPWNGNERNVTYLNLGDGRFEDVSAVSGLDFRDDGRAFAVFDFDGDGDADLVVRNRTGPELRLLQNDLANSNRSLALRLTGTKGNRDAIGARIEVETPGGRQVRFLACGSGFLSQHSKELVIGLGRYSAATRVSVRWPSGDTTEYPDLEAGYRYFLVEGAPSPKRERLSLPPAPGLDRSLPPPPAVAAAVPGLFSTNLVEPLPVPLPAALRGSRLLWLWDPSSGDTVALDPLLRVQDKVASTLVVWGDAAISSRLSAALVRAPWRADDHFRSLWTALLAYLHDDVRPPVFPKGLLFGAAAPQRLLKVYSGGARAAEILRDAIHGVPSGEKALPFPGRAILCSFRRDFRTLAAGLAMAGLDAEAEFYSARAVETNPGDAQALYNLAIARERQGKIAEATTAARGALEARPEFPQASNLLGVLLSESGHDAEARPLLEEATRTLPDFVEAWNNLGYLELNQNNFAAAEAALERALALAPDYTEALNNLGILRARQENFDQAEALFRRALSLEPDNDKAANNLAVVKVSERQPEEAAEILRGLLERHPDEQSTLLNLARLDAMMGKTAEARQLLEGWLARHPDDQAARKFLNNLR